MAVNYKDSAAHYRKRIGEFLEAYENLLAVDKEYVALDLGNNLTDLDFSDITAAQFTSGVSAAQAVMTTVDTNKTNLYIASDGGQH